MLGRQQASKMLAVIGDPVFTPDDERVRPSNDAPKRAPGEGIGYDAKASMDRYPEEAAVASAIARIEQSLPRLFGTRWEAQEIFSLAPPSMARLSLDFDADLASVTSGELAQYQIIHFATHAVINNAHPELSALVLSLVDEQGRLKDGYLHAFEVLNLKLFAELVVLSGCQTGIGKSFKGEGLVGLTKCFMYAGARRVMASLWSLNDKAAAELMARFYRRMLGPEKLRPAAALRAAQIEMRRDTRWRSPYYWAVIRPDV
jgi:CHAT domain-containing protein